MHNSGDGKKHKLATGPQSGKHRVGKRRKKLSRKQLAVLGLAKLCARLEDRSLKLPTGSSTVLGAARRTDHLSLPENADNTPILSRSRSRSRSRNRSQSGSKCHHDSHHQSGERSESPRATRHKTGAFGGHTKTGTKIGRGRGRGRGRGKRSRSRSASKSMSRSRSPSRLTRRHFAPKISSLKHHKQQRSQSQHRSRSHSPYNANKQDYSAPNCDEASGKLMPPDAPILRDQLAHERGSVHKPQEEVPKTTVQLPKSAQEMLPLLQQPALQERSTMPVPIKRVPIEDKVQQLPPSVGLEASDCLQVPQTESKRREPPPQGLFRDSLLHGIIAYHIYLKKRFPTIISWTNTNTALVAASQAPSFGKPVQSAPTVPETAPQRPNVP